MYGIQTAMFPYIPEEWFENDVNMYGIQTEKREQHATASLRMM